MRTVRSNYVGLCLFLMLVFAGSSTTAAPVPEAAKRIPADAVYAVFFSNPGEALANLDSVLVRFKSLSPEMDLARAGQQIEREIGVNLLTRAGLEAVGIDPAGTSAIYGPDMVKGPVVAIALKDANLTKQKFIALVQQKEPNFKPQPKMKAGVEIYEIDGGYIGFSGSWCLLLPPESIRKNSKDKALMAFFKGGRKLAAAPAFKRSLKEMPAEAHAWVYFDMKGLMAGWMQARQGAMKEVGKYVKSLPPDRRKKVMADLKKELAHEKKAFSKWKQALGFVENVSWGIAPKRIVLLDTGDGNYFEISQADPDLVNEEGVFRHLALRADDCASALERAREAGAEVTVETRDVNLQTEPPIPIRIAFFKGPDGELIELFQNEHT